MIVKSEHMQSQITSSECTNCACSRWFVTMCNICTCFVGIWLLSSFHYKSTLDNIGITTWNSAMAWRQMSISDRGRALARLHDGATQQNVAQRLNASQSVIRKGTGAYLVIFLGLLIKRKKVLPDRASYFFKEQPHSIKEVHTSGKPFTFLPK